MCLFTILETYITKTAAEMKEEKKWLEGLYEDKQKRHRERQIKTEKTKSVCVCKTNPWRGDVCGCNETFMLLWAHWILTVIALAGWEERAEWTRVSVSWREEAESVSQQQPLSKKHCCPTCNPDLSGQRVKPRKSLNSTDGKGLQ